jgi:putative transposase
VNHKRVLRVMRKESLLCQLKRRFVPTTDSEHSHKRYPNRIKDATLWEPDQAWVSDITYVRLPTTFVYTWLRSSTPSAAIAWGGVFRGA